VRKVVINTCFGGFGISDAGIKRYADIKGLTLFPEINSIHPSLPPIYWTVPLEDRVKEIPGGSYGWIQASLDERLKYNELYSQQTICGGDIKRDDPALVQIVEELGNEASSHHAKLKVVEIPDDINWVIEEYDGSETIAEEHQTWS
jgi:hypothetical protein